MRRQRGPKGRRQKYWLNPFIRNPAVSFKPKNRRGTNIPLFIKIKHQALLTETRDVSSAFKNVKRHLCCARYRMKQLQLDVCQFVSLIVHRPPINRKLQSVFRESSLQHDAVGVALIIRRFTMFIVVCAGAVRVRQDAL